MLFRVLPGSPVPLGEQIAACVRGAIADGTAAPGERLPPAREVADSLGVNVHTVLRGFQRLRDEGLLELRRGRGAVITAAPGAAGRARITESVHSLVRQARELGLTDQEFLSMVHNGLVGPPATAPPAP
ncbi:MULTISPECIES: GntR family transcriptional regulator [Streptomyces]|uniref:GntR family transcriptional regulator n=1 Tax=Streptomyces glycanivorans TaxID=3033808 RepID=A0ABY9J8N8_9ACTN|nr:MULTISPECIES: GntR family transcriptional regulator [unclassified Streptomyces]WSQ75847.1 GntR family transcriptional regulator [Streptomyces sp. NBC_01213]TXS12762.1 GntR family transcriptional regulator [Streptomyces sp. wa22]WLQ62341.1 GntR family transcriptional regulator [Streptomyces sp. Alt3]WSQ83095.1 GntR family transcriptional regulator [Streptomyces sp. NBC_01212]WSR10877.1 GntR family transcriptional regulator [Streptomyces sp. NBC_01208]